MVNVHFINPIYFKYNIKIIEGANTVANKNQNKTVERMLKNDYAN